MEGEAVICPVCDRIEGAGGCMEAEANRHFAANGDKRYATEFSDLIAALRGAVADFAALVAASLPPFEVLPQ